MNRDVPTVERSFVAVEAEVLHHAPETLLRFVQGEFTPLASPRTPVLRSLLLAAMSLRPRLKTMSNSRPPPAAVRQADKLSAASELARVLSLVAAGGGGECPRLG